MPAYYRQEVRTFLDTNPLQIVGVLQQAYAVDGFASQYMKQVSAWSEVIPVLQTLLREVIFTRAEAKDWSILLEFPLYRLRRRIDLILLADDSIVVIECKVGASSFSAQDKRQVEEYALDLRDFHAESKHRSILPILWCTEAEDDEQYCPSAVKTPDTVLPVLCTGTRGLTNLFRELQFHTGTDLILPEAWDTAQYRPIPSVIDAATMIFSGHGVRAIANADADNLNSASTRLISLIREARELKRRYLVLLTGVPGSGKTLAGLNVVHSAIEAGIENKGDIVYLSGNSPLVIVLREALARDEYVRATQSGHRRPLGDIRRDARVRIQHINDFLQQCLRGSPEEPPEEHVIIFDEAQRAWDEKQGLEKFNRTASEPLLLLELMSRHPEWCVCVCLVGTGQEINSGEEGVRGWGQALVELQPHVRGEWAICAPKDVLKDDQSPQAISLSTIPDEISIKVESNLQLRVPQRSYRSPSVSKWVDHVLSGNENDARLLATKLGEYPIMMTRSLDSAKKWLRDNGRGERRFGLVASSGARRLRAEGIGTLLHASSGNEIAQWYLNPPGDIRSSFALEVPANEYTCQGLELDLVCVCWGGDLLWDEVNRVWSHQRLSGTGWQMIRNAARQLYLRNSYRVLLTRAREGLIIWIPEGNDLDETRACSPRNATVEFLARCGATKLDS